MLPFKMQPDLSATLSSASGTSAESSSKRATRIRTASTRKERRMSAPDAISLLIVDAPSLFAFRRDPFGSSRRLRLSYEPTLCFADAFARPRRRLVVRSVLQPRMRLFLANRSQRCDRHDLFLSRRRLLVLPVVDRLHADAEQPSQLGRGESEPFAQRDEPFGHEPNRRTVCDSRCGLASGRGFREVFGASFERSDRPLKRCDLATVRGGRFAKRSDLLPNFSP